MRPGQGKSENKMMSWRVGNAAWSVGPPGSLILVWELFKLEYGKGPIFLAEGLGISMSDWARDTTEENKGGKGMGLKIAAGRSGRYPQSQQFGYFCLFLFCCAGD